MNLTLAFGRAIVKIFFREVVIEGRDRLPSAGPVIFAPNHPNGLMDPLVLLFLAPAFRLHFVAKAPLFRIPVFGSILRSIGAIPVMRKMDAAGEVDYTAFFSSCVEVLTTGGSIVIFPEGRSLPQSYLAPMKTGPARLFFQARERSTNVDIVPVGLNYERGSIFRSRVLVALAPPLDTLPEQRVNDSDSVEAVRALTEKIGAALDQHVIQAKTYRDRELMLLLERLYGEVPEDQDWRARFSRLKLFESGLSHLSAAEPQRVDKVRNLLSRYERIATSYGANAVTQSWRLVLMPLAVIGWLLNAIPYKIVDLLVRRLDAAEAATFKIVYSLFAFPIAYVIEAIAIARLFGSTSAVIFAIVILPLSYFSQKMSDWWEEYSPMLLSGSKRQRAAQQLARLKQRITEEVDFLASKTTQSH